MSKIPYRFRTPIPFSFEKKNGILDPSKKIYHKRLAFVKWAFGQCYTIPFTRDGISYAPFEFSMSHERGAKECGLTPDEFSTQVEFFEKLHFLEKIPNSLKNRVNSYRWKVEKFSEEKIIEIEKIPNQNTSQTTDNEEEKDKSSEKIPNQNEKSPTDSPTKSPTVLLEEIQKNTQPITEQNPPFYKNDKEAIELSLSNSDNEYKPRAREDISLSSKGQSIAFSNKRVFNPRTYRLRNGDLLTQWMQNSLGKYVGNARERLLANVLHYEEWVDSGGIIKESHEAYLQNCIKFDYAKEKEYSMQNDLYAQFLKTEYNLKEMEIMKTVVKIKKPQNGETMSIPKKLPPHSFSDALDNYIKNNYSGLRNGS